MDIESYFISQFSRKYIGDDAAIVDGLIYSKDAFFEGVHFKKEWMTYKEVAQKAMLVNISDAVAMNAQPLYALLSVAMPKNITKQEAKELAQGFKEIANEYGIEIIGGDTIANTKLDITITVISKSKKPLLRKGMKKGDLLAYTGDLGRSIKDLRTLFRGGKIRKDSKFKSPTLRWKFIQKTRKYLHCGMDISDGLFSDLEKLSRFNNLGYKFFHKIPKSIGCSGEEYELLFSFDKRYKTAIIRQAKRTRTKINICAVAQNKRFFNTCKRHHF
ncbi:MAG: thiamine-phosphate kinase [Epsilonproteobacteria bacterium]|nr:thiamine-phosphate kinase [Campylobacterota bacterium]